MAIQCVGNPWAYNIRNGSGDKGKWTPVNVISLYNISQALIYLFAILDLEPAMPVLNNTQLYA